MTQKRIISGKFHLVIIIGKMKNCKYNLYKKKIIMPLLDGPCVPTSNLLDIKPDYDT